ncbi:hypothetical protein LCGC14_1337850 [marine sediment metagenome]|uniref:Nuclease associated modular domain-containing protein n=1 Tax=marine sediment metagenome TaxID=412755 RepID=A0A0F9MVF7_9ZZZZ
MNCICGCNEEVIQKSKYYTSKFIKGHNSKGENNPMFGKSAMKGRKHTEKSRQEMSKNNYMTGRVGKLHPRYGKPISDRTCKLISNSKKILYKDKTKHPIYGKHRSDITKQRISDGNKGKTISEESRQKMRASAYKRPINNEKFKNTKPERFLKSILSINGIEYESQKNIYGRPDIFIKPNTCVFVDGCYWHGCTQCMNEKALNHTSPKKKSINDININKTLKKQGYKIVRIWEHDIKNDLNSCLNKIQEGVFSCER